MVIRYHILLKISLTIFLEELTVTCAKNVYGVINLESKILSIQLYYFIEIH